MNRRIIANTLRLLAGVLLGVAITTAALDAFAARIDPYVPDCVNLFLEENIGIEGESCDATNAPIANVRLVASVYTAKAKGNNGNGPTHCGNCNGNNGNGNGNGGPSVPEPGTFVLALLGLMGLAYAGRKR